MTKISVLALNMETPQRFDDVIRDQQKKLLDKKPTTGRHGELLRKTLAPFAGSGAWLLDAGCGAGHYLPLFRDLGLRVVGADFSPVVLTRAREINPQAALEMVALESTYGLPHRDRSFDAIFCGEVIAHIRDVHWVLSEFNRVLRDGGLLIITTPYHGWIKNVIIASFLFERHFYPHNYRLRFFTRSSLVTSLLRAGFTTEDCRGGGGWWPWWHTMYAVSRKVNAPGPAPNPLKASGLR